ncbi:Uncharacterized protein TCM_003253 [Theobroma cacao]|uniref:Uncharacterized protein n=1 Tax=Theobroma cacao TaxID=3641 RepID=A0A061DMR3_THECC|nr:Uncharacterized protein TCM_003253 [Theobroma cacao]
MDEDVMEEGPTVTAIKDLVGDAVNTARDPMGDGQFIDHSDGARNEEGDGHGLMVMSQLSTPSSEALPPPPIKDAWLSMASKYLRSPYVNPLLVQRKAKDALKDIYKRFKTNVQAK